MALFSERYGYAKVSDVIIRETITPEIQNAICSCFDRLYTLFETSSTHNICYERVTALESYIWTNFLNLRLSNYDYASFSLSNYIEDPFRPWYEKIDMIECVLKYMYEREDLFKQSITKTFVSMLNSEFKRLHFAYRIVNYEIVEISSDQEVKTIESAIENSQQNIKMHLNSALEKYALRPDGDYRNSIKESISAVEAFCREKTGKSTLGKALSELEKKIIIPQSLKSAFHQLYEYTNHSDTGIRHALMDDNGSYTPTADEALFMLVSCSAFINYLSKKV